MGQTSKIVLAVFVAFIVFVTMRGRLRDYLEVMGIV